LAEKDNSMPPLSSFELEREAHFMSNLKFSSFSLVFCSFPVRRLPMELSPNLGDGRVQAAAI
jgi:hypothetical protein